jgi:hypothetical protein
MPIFAFYAFALMNYPKLEPEDYYVNEQGYVVMTEKYHLKRGYCCGNTCKHCPFNHIEVKNKQPKST